MIWSWLRRKLGIDASEARLTMLRGHVLYLDQWVRNLDQALQQLQASHEPRDMKKMATQIREQVMAIKSTFPTRADDVKG